MSMLKALEDRMENATREFCRTPRVESGETGRHPAVPVSAGDDATATGCLRRFSSTDDRMEEATQRFCRVTDEDDDS